MKKQTERFCIECLVTFGLLTALAFASSGLVVVIMGLF